MKKKKKKKEEEKKKKKKSSVIDGAWTSPARCYSLSIDVKAYAVATHSHKGPSRNSYVTQFSWNGVGRGYLVVVTGSTWLLRGLRPSNFREIALLSKNRVNKSLHLWSE